MNDLPKVIGHCQVLMCVDDTTVFYSGKLASIFESKLTADLDVISSWLCNNSSFLNVTKTGAMLFGTQAKLSQVTDFCMTFNANPIRHVSEFKYEFFLMRKSHGILMLSVSYQQQGKDWAC